jgi:hypothetical protein
MQNMQNMQSIQGIPVVPDWYTQAANQVHTSEHFHSERLIRLSSASLAMRRSGEVGRPVLGSDEAPRARYFVI